MENEENEEIPPPFWLRLCGAVVGLLWGAVAPVLICFLAVFVGGASGRGVALMALVVIGGIAGAAYGFNQPRKTVDSLLIFLPGSVE